MAEKIETYEKEIVEVINENKIYTINDIFAFYTGIRKSQFYNLGLEKSDLIKESLNNNKTRAKMTSLRKWEKSDNPTLQVAFVKLICTEEEAHRLNGSKTESKTENNHTISIDPKKWV